MRALYTLPGPDQRHERRCEEVEERDLGVALSDADGEEGADVPDSPLAAALPE